MENREYELNDTISTNTLEPLNDSNMNSRPVMYMSRNKFLKKYGLSAVIFDTYFKSGLFPFLRTGKVIEIEEYRTLEILKEIETENAEVVRKKHENQPVSLGVPIVLADRKGIKIRRKKLDA